MVKPLAGNGPDLEGAAPGLSLAPMSFLSQAAVRYCWIGDG